MQQLKLVLVIVLLKPNRYNRIAAEELMLRSPAIAQGTEIDQDTPSDGANARAATENLSACKTSRT